MGCAVNRVDGADAPYWAGLTEGKLMLPQCQGCGRWKWPAGHRCGSCGTSGMQWIECEMRATIFAWTRTWHRFGLTESLEIPFTSGTVEVENCGIRLLGRIDDPNRINPVIGEKLVGRPGTTVVGDDEIPTIIWSRIT